MRSAASCATSRSSRPPARRATSSRSRSARPSAMATNPPRSSRCAASRRSSGRRSGPSTGPRPPVAEPSADIGSKLQAWLEGREVDALVEVTGRATVGLSQDTWFVRVTGADGAVEGVLRLPTPSSGPQAILTQAVALQAVAGRLPAPAVLWHDADADNPFGAPFLVMERIAGMVPVGWHDVPEPERTVLAEQAVDGLAALHAVDPAPLGSAAADARPTDLAFYLRRLERFAPLPPVL